MSAPTFDAIVDYESGLMEPYEVIMFFQDLIDSGVVWHLQGHYGRMATALIEQGHCMPALQLYAATDTAGSKHTYWARSVAAAEAMFYAEFPHDDQPDVSSIDF